MMICFIFILNSGLAQTNKDKRPERIVIKAIEGMQFDKVRLWVKPDTRVRLILANESKEEHNLVITKPGLRQKVVNAALRMGVKGKQMNFVPKSDDVLWSIPVISKSQSDSISFVAPKVEGVYPYVCTFPGHGNVMFGALYVTKEKKWPLLKEDENIPSIRRK